MKWVSSLDAIMVQCIASKVVSFWSKTLSFATICYHTRPPMYARIKSSSQVLSCRNKMQTTWLQDQCEMVFTFIDQILEINGY